MLGDAGEETFKHDTISRHLNADVVVFKVFCFEAFDQVYQIDFIIFNHGRIELVDIKNFVASASLDGSINAIWNIPVVCCS